VNQLLKSISLQVTSLNFITTIFVSMQLNCFPSSI